MTKIAIQGISGRMGQALCRLIEARSDCQVVAGGLWLGKVRFLWKR